MRKWLGGLSFRTGVILMILCVGFYVASFAQMLLPLSATVKAVLWFVLFGLAKATQYSGIIVLGTAGLTRLRRWWRKRSG